MPASDATPRDLLFGLLALQNGLIDQDQLVSAFSAWSRSRGRALAAILVERGSIDDECRTLLEGMARKHLQLHGGDAARSLAAIAPAPSTRRLLSEVDDADLAGSLRLVGPEVDEDDPYRTASHAPSPGPASGSAERFRILRPHARGGLGAVYVAMDAELNREVALKEILERHADDPHSRARFRIEAEITGGLEHPGIVPVYGLGHHDDGRPYYAMRFIRGDSLQEAIAAFHAEQGPGKARGRDPGGRSLALRGLLRRFVDVCNAVDYAHGRGVLHLDLKPGNVIVGKHGQTLVVDWGLAKPMGRADPLAPRDERTLRPSSSADGASTLPGSAVGTPAFMSPEQAGGDLDRIGPRSDVYSLGATLYCLLTGRPPFRGKDLGAVLRAVEEGDFPAPRRVDPSIDRALEAVCLKAMANRPDDRHATARDLADDVDRWAADEPVSAWREPATVRARRWMRRNRTAVAAASASVLVALVGLAGISAVQSRANARLAAANRELAEANGRVQARFDLAREAIRSFQGAVTDDEMLRGPELKGLRNKLLRSAAGFYRQLETLLLGQPDDSARAILARSYFELAELTGQIGIQPEALAIHRKALAIRRELAARPGAGAGAGARLDVARSLMAVGLLVEGTGDPAGALAAVEEAHALAAPMAEGPGATDEAREVLGNADQRIGRTLQSLGRPADALRLALEALAIFDRLARDRPEVAEYRRRLAVSHNNIGVLRGEDGKLDEALQSYRQARAIQQKLADDQPEVVDHRSRLAACRSNIGDVLMRSGHPAEALAEDGEALAIRRKIVEEHPAVTEYLGDLADSLLNLGILQTSTGRRAEALASHREALAIRERMARDHPEVVDFRRRAADIHLNIGVQRLAVGKLDEALRSHDEALAIYRKLAEIQPEVTDFPEGVVSTLNNIGEIRAQAGRPAEALAAFVEALAIQEKLVAEHPEVDAFRRALSGFHVNLGDTRMAARDPAEALASYRAAAGLREGLVKANPESLRDRVNLAASLAAIGSASAAVGDLAAAIDAYARAVTIQANLSPTRDRLYNLACYQSLHSGLIARGGGADARIEAGRAAVDAVTSLTRAIRAGYRDLGNISRDGDLDPIRARADFQALVLDLAFPADPFAR